jgi:hypothetical protein
MCDKQTGGASDFTIRTEDFSVGLGIEDVFRPVFAATPNRLQSV